MASQLSVAVLTDDEAHALEKYRNGKITDERLEEIRWELVKLMEECSKMGVRWVIKTRSADGSRECFSSVYGAKINHYVCNDSKEIEFIH
jgi:hypothetical protein